MRRELLLLLLLTATPVEGAEISSPAGRNTVQLEVDGGIARYRVLHDGKTVIDASRLGVVLRDEPTFDARLRLGQTSTRSHEGAWTQPWGEKKHIAEVYQELRAELIAASGRRMDVVFRVFDDGVGFRYEWPAQDGLSYFEIVDELSEFALPADAKAWWIGAYQPNRYEYLYQSSRVDALDVVHTPVTFEYGDGTVVSLHEAALTDYASMTLRRHGDGRLQADLVPWSDGIKVKAQAPHVSPWRTLQIGDDPGELITSYLVLNLNEPNALGDVSWVRPGKYVGIWWAMHIGTATWGAGPKHGATTANAREYIDFAARHGFGGVLIEGWNLGWDGDWTRQKNGFQFTTPYPDFDIEELSRYAARQGVRIIGHHETGADVDNYERQMEAAFAYYRGLGINAVKTGYVGWGQNIERTDENGVKQSEWHHGQYMVRHYRKVVKTAARHGIMLDVHEPIKDTGLRRTYPNMMTREGARGQEYDAWSDDGGNPPEHTTILPFTRLLAGPMDFTPGTFDILIGPRPANRVNTTLAKQLALYVVIYSPLQMASDLPGNYEANLPALKFIEDVPCDWDDTVVLGAKIGDTVTIARRERDGDDWFIGSITDENGRTVQAKLDFLEPGRNYLARIYRDGPGAHWETQPLSLEIDSMPVTQETVLSLVLAPGGGQALHLRLVR